MKYSPNDILGIDPNDILDGKNRKRKSRYKKEQPQVTEAEYQGKKVTLNKPFRTPDGPKKFSVYVKNKKGNISKVNFGDPNMEIRRDDPEARKSFRARHKCDQKKDKTTPGYWSCYQWRKGAKVVDSISFNRKDNLVENLIDELLSL